MYKKILVALDGSDLSECSLPHVKSIAQGCNVPEVVLLRVVEPLSSYTVSALATAGDDNINKVMRGSQAEATKYLAMIGKNLEKEGIKARLVLLDGNPAEQILDYTSKNHVDLVIMTTHGRSGPSSWIMGSVADNVMRHSAVPVLIVSPPSCRTGA